MPQTLRGIDRDRLERSCNPRRDWIRFGASAPGVERAEVQLTTCAFEPHRHDTYAIGSPRRACNGFGTAARAASACPARCTSSTPTRSTTADPEPRGLRLCILYIAPELIRDALDGAALPFVADPVPKLTPATRLVASLLADIDEPISDLAQTEIAATLADLLRSLGGQRECRGCSRSGNGTPPQYCASKPGLSHRDDGVPARADQGFADPVAVSSTKPGNFPASALRRSPYSLRARLQPNRAPWSAQPGE
jgi:hypothetical protein